MSPRFLLGEVYITPNVLAQVPPEETLRALDRHRCGDWGDLSLEDRAANDRALVSGDRLLSAYRSKRGAKFWIITEWDRSSTTILLPEDY